MADFFSWLDTAVGNVAKATGSDKNEFISGAIQSVVKTIDTGKPTIVTKAGTGTLGGLSVNPSGLTATVQVEPTKDTLNKSLLWIGISIVAAVCIAVFIPKLLFSKKKKYRYA